MIKLIPPPTPKKTLCFLGKSVGDFTHAALKGNFEELIDFAKEVSYLSEMTKQQP